MSRVGKKTIIIPKGVEIQIENVTEQSKECIRVKGPHGQVLVAWDSHRFQLNSENENSQSVVRISRSNESRDTIALHGTIRANLANGVYGVLQKFQKELRLVGVGYRVQKSGNNLVLLLGYSKSKTVAIPKEIDIEIENQIKIKLTSVNKELLGTFTSYLRSLRKIDPYKGKGILEVGKPIRRKAGKSGKVAQK